MAEVVLAEEPADSDDVRWCFEQYYAELDRRFRAGFDVDAALPLGIDELTPPHGAVLIAREEGLPVGCGGVKLAEPRVGEIKRMWVSERMRGRGIGGRILADLEARAIEAGKSVARLETNRNLGEAIAMYRKRGYREVAPFNEEQYGDHWFEKDLTSGDRA